MSDFKAKMYLAFRLGFARDPAGGAYSAISELCLRGLLLKGGRGREEKGRAKGRGRKDKGE